jgi:hypothetical protein
MEQSVPKCLHIKFRCQGITQKKAYNFQHGKSLKSIFKLLNQIHPLMFCSFTTKLAEKYNSIRYKQTSYNSVHSYLGNINKSNLLGSSWSVSPVKVKILYTYSVLLYQQHFPSFLTKLRTTAV